MKYWRGYLVAGVLAFFTWGLMQFAQTHGQVLDLIYPFLTRSVQDSLAAWSGQVDVCLWQLLLVLLGVACVASIVLMIILRWNPIQWFGWVLAVASLIFFLHTGIGGLNTYTGALADDLHLSVSEYTLQELKDATIYYRDHANTLAAQVAREGNSVSFSDFDTLAAQAGDGFQRLTYEDYYAVFAGSTAPVKKLGWAEMYTSMGITGVTMPLTGEAAVNPTVPAVSIPFTMCHEMAHRMSITLERDANFAAFLACQANSSLEFQYSGYFMAYRYCYNALYGAAGRDAAQEIANGANQYLQQDLYDYNYYFQSNRDEKASKLADKANDTYIKVSGDDRGVASYGDVCDLLVCWHIQTVTLPAQLENPETPFDPLDESQVDLSGLPHGPQPTTPPEDQGTDGTEPE